MQIPPDGIGPWSESERGGKQSKLVRVSQLGTFFDRPGGGCGTGPFERVKKVRKSQTGIFFARLFARLLRSARARRLPISMSPVPSSSPPCQVRALRMPHPRRRGIIISPALPRVSFRGRVSPPRRSLGGAGRGRWSAEAGRGDAELLENSKAIGLDPGAENLPLPHPVEGHPGVGDPLVAGRNLPELARLGPGPAPADRDPVPFGNQVLHREVDIGESALQALEVATESGGPLLAALADIVRRNSSSRRQGSSSAFAIAAAPTCSTSVSLVASPTPP